MVGDIVAVVGSFSLVAGILLLFWTIAETGGFDTRERAWRTPTFIGLLALGVAMMVLTARVAS
jgi:hypothetical protein